MKIVVLAGGLSTERDVSISSRTNIYQALKEKGHQVIFLDVYLGYEGKVDNTIFDADYQWIDSSAKVKEINPDLAEVKALRSDGGETFFGPNVISICQLADIVFLALHGADGENGKLQAAFDLLGITYTGNDYVSCALAMDKGLAKELFVSHNIPTPKGIRLHKTEEDLHEVPLPCVVKAIYGGSSVGVYIVNTESEYEKAKEAAFCYDDEVVIEEYIKGREFAIAVVDGKALPIIEIAPISGFYDYKNKYQAGSAIETCPAHLEETLAKKMQQTAVDVFHALRLTSYARMDFLLKENGEYYCLEANTLPGMTPTSLIPQEASAMGVDYVELCEWIMKLALKES